MTEIADLDRCSPRYWIRWYGKAVNVYFLKIAWSRSAGRFFDDI